MRRLNQLALKEGQSNDVKFFVALALARYYCLSGIFVPSSLGSLGSLCFVAAHVLDTTRTGWRRTQSFVA